MTHKTKEAQNQYATLVQLGWTWHVDEDLWTNLKYCLPNEEGGTPLKFTLQAACEKEGL